MIHLRNETNGYFFLKIHQNIKIVRGFLETAFDGLFVTLFLKYEQCRSTFEKPVVNIYEHKRHPNAQNKLNFSFLFQDFLINL